MSLVWLVPATLLVGATALSVHWVRSLQAELVSLQRSALRLAPITHQVQAVRAEVGRTATAAESTLDSLGVAPRR